MPMKIVTYQASAYRYPATRAGRPAAARGCLTAGGRPSPAGTARSQAAAARGTSATDPTPGRGSNRSAARAAGAAIQPRVSATEPPVLVQSGTLTSEPTIAPT